MEYRHEIKHMITPGDAVAVRCNLSAVARLDPHAGKEGCYRVQSLYFDDLKDTALWEKLDGVDERSKFRIRWYNGDLSYIMLERKIKQGQASCKLQEALKPEELRRIMDGDTAWMAGCGRPLALKLYVEMKTRGLRPRCLVEYMRMPFVYDPGQVRVTIDWNIRTGTPKAFIASHELTLPVMGNPILLEVKWGEYLPAVIRRAAGLKNRQASSFSKYAASRMYG